MELHGSVGNEIVLVVDPTRSSWNKQLGDESLRLPLPAGTKVSDEERGVRYVTGQPDPGKNLDDLAKHARDVVPIATFTPQPKTSWYTWVFYGLGAAVAVVLLGVVGIVVRKHFAR